MANVVKLSLTTTTAFLRNFPPSPIYNHNTSWHNGDLAFEALRRLAGKGNTQAIDAVAQLANDGHGKAREYLDRSQQDNGTAIVIENAVKLGNSFSTSSTAQAMKRGGWCSSHSSL